MEVLKIKGMLYIKITNKIAKMLLEEGKKVFIFNNKCYINCESVEV